MTNKGKSKKIVTVDASDLVDPQMEEAQIQEILSRLDQKRIDACQKNLDEAKEKISKKVYAVQFESSEDLENYFEFMHNEAEWREKESLGVIEICKVLSKLQSDGIKQNTIYLSALPLEASHYFLSKKSGKGLAEAQKYIRILKPFGIALESPKADAAHIQELEKELAAAQQGIELE
jgi:hypothetical protein